MDATARMSTPAERGEARTLSLRPFALPVEHGGWGFLLEPLILALLVAPSLAGLLITIAALGSFLTRHPLKLAVRDWLSPRTYPRTRICAGFAALYGAITAAALIASVLLTDWRVVVPLVIALPLAAVQFFYDVRNRTRDAVPELCGAIAAGAGGAACALAGGAPLRIAAIVWLLTLLRAVPTVLYVRALVRRHHHAAQIAAHVAALVIVGFLFVPPSAVSIVFALLLARAAAAPLRPAVRPSVIGREELLWGALTVAGGAVSLM